MMTVIMNSLSLADEALDSVDRPSEEYEQIAPAIQALGATPELSGESQSETDHDLEFQTKALRSHDNFTKSGSNFNTNLKEKESSHIKLINQNEGGDQINPQDKQITYRDSYNIYQIDST